MRITKQTKEKLTDRQSEVLRFIKIFMKCNQRPPSTRDVAKCFDITVRSAKLHIDAIEQKGHIRVDRNVSRGIVIEGDICPYCNNKIK